ncbi:CHAT domain-containing protein [Micromonospora sp. NBS 11-29]|uniref:CHAT domain-containing protein n=1 Tax=Micromonospora sp. NBS 11-29 TaxID=1960879 RepID=UPI000B7912AA|nr:CHAT domain-containing protein [Micromonospora sp. NBS 11-29]
MTQECVDVHLTLAREHQGRLHVSLTVAANDFVESWTDGYQAGDRSFLEEYAADVLSFEAVAGQLDIRHPGRLYENLLFRGAAWDNLLEMRRTLAGRAYIRFVLSGDPEVVDLAWEAAPIPRLSGGVGPLGGERDTSLVRVTGGTARRSAGMTNSRVLVATATDLTGPQRLPDGLAIDLGDASGPLPRDADRIRATLGSIGYEVDEPAEVTRSSLGGKLSARHHAVVFCGHRVTTPRPGLVVHAAADDEEATADLLDDDWLAALVGGAPPAFVALVACHSGSAVGSCGPLARRLAAAGVPLVAGVYGAIAHHDADEFVATLFEELAQGSPADVAVAVARTRFRDRSVLPVVYAHDLSGLRQQAPAPKLPEPVTFRARAFPAGWSPRTPMPLSADRWSRLDLLCTLDRGPLTVVLADTASLSLADSLNAAEDLLQRVAVRRRHPLTRRAWRDYDAAKAIPETRADWLNLTSHPATVRALLAERPDAANLGLVVRAHVPRPAWRYGDEWARLIARFAEFRDTELPAAALLVRVVADTPLDAVLGAADVAGRMAPRHEPDLLYRDQPWAGSATPLRGTGAAAFRAAVAAARRARGLQTDPPPPVDGDPASADTAARQLVAAPPERFADEVALLLDVRDWLPGCFQPLLTAYARHRDGPGRYAALVAAAGVDDHLDRWLAEAVAAGRPPQPDEAPAAALRSHVVDALLWALRRRRDRALLDTWLEWRVDEPAYRLIGRARAGAARPDWAAEDPAAVRTWARETKLTWAALSEADPALPGWWAAMSQVPLTPESAESLLTMSHPFPLVTGLRDPDDRTRGDVTDADLVAVLRRGYQPTRYERA